MPRLAPKVTSPPPHPPPAVPAIRQLLNYMPNGPLGGTFSCTRCGAQAWQPDLMDHAPNCAYRSPAAP